MFTDRLFFKILPKICLSCSRRGTLIFLENGKIWHCITCLSQHEGWSQIFVGNRILHWVLGSKYQTHVLQCDFIMIITNTWESNMMWSLSGWYLLNMHKKKKEAEGQKNTSLVFDIPAHPYPPRFNIFQSLQSYPLICSYVRVFDKSPPPVPYPFKWNGPWQV